MRLRASHSTLKLCMHRLNPCKPVAQVQRPRVAACSSSSGSRHTRQSRRGGMRPHLECRWSAARHVLSSKYIAANFSLPRLAAHLNWSKKTGGYVCLPVLGQLHGIGGRRRSGGGAVHAGLRPSDVLETLKNNSGGGQMPRTVHNWPQANRGATHAVRACAFSTRGLALKATSWLHSTPASRASDPLAAAGRPTPVPPAPRPTPLPPRCPYSRSPHY